MHASLLIQWDVDAESAGLQGYTQLHSENEASLSYMKPNLKQNWTKQNQQIAVSLNDKNVFSDILFPTGLLLIIHFNIYLLDS